MDGDTYKAYNYRKNTTIHHTREQHPTTDETQTETQTTSTLLAQAANLEPIPLSKKKQKKNSSKQASLSRHDHRVPVPATDVVVICEPQGLSNPIIMCIKTSKA